MTPEIFVRCTWFLAFAQIAFDGQLRKAMSTNTSDNGTKAADQTLASLTDPWYLKRITFEGRPVRIITQNFNGSVSVARSVQFDHIINVLLGLVLSLRYVGIIMTSYMRLINALLRQYLDSQRRRRNLAAR